MLVSCGVKHAECFLSQCQEQREKTNELKVEKVKKVDNVFFDNKTKIILTITLHDDVNVQYCLPSKDQFIKQIYSCKKNPFPLPRCALLVISAQLECHSLEFLVLLEFPR